VDLVTTMYVRWPGDVDSLAQVVAPLVGGEVQQFNQVTGPVLELDVEENEERDDERAAADRDGFLYFPYYLEMEPAAPDAGESGVIAAVAALLEGLAAAGAQVVTAAAFEDQLPGGGRAGPPPSA
jgi:hypothetical protein